MWRLRMHRRGPAPRIDSSVWILPSANIQPIYHETHHGHRKESPRSCQEVHEVGPRRQQSLTLRWMIGAVDGRPERTAIERLAAALAAPDTPLPPVSPPSSALGTDKLSSKEN